MQRLSRREFTQAGAVTTVASLAACDVLSTDPTEESTGRESGSAEEMEAPSLSEQVGDGTLPRLAERLPDSPRLVEPVERAGVYGGTWNTAFLGEADTAWLSRIMIIQDRLLGWDLEWENLVPNVAESFEFSDDATEYTFHLRPGTRWSDGELFTADDIMFWYEDVFSNEELTPAPAQYLTANDEPVEVRKIDDHTVQFVFPGPNGLFPQWLATYDLSFRLTPRHYLEQFHTTYNPEVDQLVEEEGQEDWVGLFFSKLDLWANPDLPRLHAWLPTAPLGEGASRFVCERNPYYYKVDPDGRQLPYIDRIVFELASDEQTLILKASNGELGMHVRHINTPANKPVLARNREQGAYHFIDLRNSYPNTMVLGLNLTHQDQTKREIFQNRDFRIGLSHAINRQEIIDTVYQRQGRPWQGPLRPETPFADEEMGTQYTEYNVDLANDYLDRAGYAERDADGMRLGPDGERISFSILTQSRYFEMIDTLELIRGYWREVGIDMRPENLDGTLWQTRIDANEHDGAVDDPSPGHIDTVIDPRWLFAGASASRAYAPTWVDWYEDPTTGDEPPEAMKQQMEIYRNEVQTTLDVDERYDAMGRIVQIGKEQFWIMGISLPPNGYGIVANNFQNVPDQMWDSFRYGTPGPSNPSQYFIQD